MNLCTETFEGGQRANKLEVSSYEQRYIFAHIALLAKWCDACQAMADTIGGRLEKLLSILVRGKILCSNTIEMDNAFN